MTVALVLSGGGARGAYEVGVLSALLPALADDERPRLLVGTSVGALNTAYLAANADMPADELTAAARRIYGSIGWSDVLAAPWSPVELSYLLRYVLGALGDRRARIPALLDPSPLAVTIERLIPDFGAIGRNIANGVLDAAAVVATSALTSRSVVFHEGGTPRAEHDDRRGIDYAAVELTAQHVRASAAIPAVFPAVHVDGEPGRGWYFDGGTRLNTPVKPALWMGADRIIAVGLNAAVAPFPGSLAGEERPDLFAGAGQIMIGLLSDPMSEDIGTLASINQMIGGRRALAGRRPVPYIFVSPPEADTIGRIAAEVFRTRYRSLRLPARSPQLALLGRLVEGDFDGAHGELLSYLFFDPDFMLALVDQGRADGERWLRAPHDDGLWEIGPLQP